LEEEKAAIQKEKIYIEIFKVTIPQNLLFQKQKKRKIC
jgi:hypothetical protein